MVSGVAASNFFKFPWNCGGTVLKAKTCIKGNVGNNGNKKSWNSMFEFTTGNRKDNFVSAKVVRLQ